MGAERGDEPRSRPTLRDVGRLAGVTGATASYVLNGRADGQVSAETSARVLRAAAELGYRPNSAARALRTRRHRIVGLVLGEVHHNPPPIWAMAGAHDEARARGHSLLVTNAIGTRAGLRRAFDELLDRQVDSIVVAVSGTRAVPVPTPIDGTPVVLVNCFPTPDGVPCVLPEEEAGGRAAADFVLAQGHRRVALLAGVASLWATQARVRGYRSALACAGLPDDDGLVRYGTYRMASGYHLAREVLGGSPPPTALLCGNDRMALGAYVAVAEAGLRIPDDVSVMGYDDEPELASEAVPALSTVRLPYEAMGQWAVRQLLSGAYDTLPPRTLIPCEVVPRDSVAPPTRVQTATR
ncbi:MAG TPA: LacI family DNA-binding transcriptional regulator [Kineosporiaceae bacterium]|nr:LacI family DNA-binding transcriptional regulator [Kineosporiaceae bacterium]